MWYAVPELENSYNMDLLILKILQRFSWNKAKVTVYVIMLTQVVLTLSPEWKWLFLIKLEYIGKLGWSSLKTLISVEVICNYLVILMTTMLNKMHILLKVVRIFDFVHHGIHQCDWHVSECRHNSPPAYRSKTSFTFLNTLVHVSEEKFNWTRN